MIKCCLAKAEVEGSSPMHAAGGLAFGDRGGEAGLLSPPAFQCPCPWSSYHYCCKGPTK